MKTCWLLVVGWAPKSVKYASSSVTYFRSSLFALAISLLIIFVCVVGVNCWLCCLGLSVVCRVVCVII